MTALALILALTSSPALAGDPKVEAHQKQLLSTLVHFALIFPPNAQDPVRSLYASKLATLRQQADLPLDRQGVEMLQKAFDSWKAEVCANIYGLHGEAECDSLHGDVGKLAKLAESGKEKLTPQFKSRIASEWKVLGPAEQAWFLDRVFDKSSGNGVLYADRKLAAQRNDASWEKRYFVDYTPAPNSFKTFAAEPPGPDLGDPSLINDMVSYISQNWEISKKNLKYVPMVVKAAFDASKELGPTFPALYAALVLAESHYNPGARSPKNAKGLGQVMQYNAPGVNLFDPRKNIVESLKYLREKKQALQAHGLTAWEHLLMSYNAGLNRTIKRRGNVKIPETVRYVRGIMKNYADLKNRFFNPDPKAS